MRNQRIQYIHDHGMSQPMKSYTQTFPVSQDAIYALENLRTDPTRPWRYEHLVRQGGVQGWHALNCAEAEVFVLEGVIRTRGFASLAPSRERHVTIPLDHPLLPVALSAHTGSAEARERHNLLAGSLWLHRGPSMHTGSGVAWPPSM